MQGLNDKSRMSGDVHVRICERVGVRFPRATRLVVVCAIEEDAQRIMAVLPKRFGKYGLTLHPEKTHIMRFRRPPHRSQGAQSQRLAWPESFDVLGFTYYWGRSRRGTRAIKRKTAKGRLSRALKRINTWCRRYRHAPVAWQHQQLAQKLRQKWLNRRSQRSGMPWDRFYHLLERYPLPNTHIVHAASRA